MFFLTCQLEQWRQEARREKDLRRRLEVEVKNREERMMRLEADLKRLALSNEDLGRQLDVAMVSHHLPHPALLLFASRLFYAFIGLLKVVWDCSKTRNTCRNGSGF